MLSPRFLCITLACGWLLDSASASGHPASFTLEQVMAAPYPSELLSGSTGKAVV